MIGFYNPSVILTYIALLVSTAGIFLTICNHITGAVICLVVAGVCDSFDGKIARAIRRNEDEKSFGIQIDSLCDLIGFGALPVVIAYMSGVDTIVGMAVLMLYLLAGVIRLAYYNVTEQNRQQVESGLRTHYQGLPITSISVILPLFHLLRHVLGDWYGPLLTALLGLVALLFLLNIRVPKIKV